MSKKILIVEDEQNIVDILKFNLRKEGFETMEATDGETAVEMALSQNPDLILLDIMLPKLDGISVCMKLRESITTPIIMLTARADELDRVLGLELGADDYMVKPFSPRELIARIKASLRRTAGAEGYVGSTANTLYCRDLVIDIARMGVTRNGEEIELTTKEFELLRFLLQNRGKVLSRENLLEKVWGYEFYGDLRIVDVTVSRLKKKLERNPSEPEYIMTRRGVGYYFNE